MIRCLLPKHPVRSEPYLAWVRSLSCTGCGIAPAGCAHHCIADRYASRKASDLHAMPMCADCHRTLHEDWPAWESQHGSQWKFVSETLELAGRMGVITIDARAARECG